MEPFESFLINDLINFPERVFLEVLNISFKGPPFAASLDETITFCLGYSGMPSVIEEVNHLFTHIPFIKNNSLSG